MLQEVALPCGGDPPAFMAAAAAFANDRCWGTLSCSLIVHPATQRAHRGAYNALLADLKYGAITVNCPGVSPSHGAGACLAGWGHGWLGAAGARPRIRPLQWAEGGRTQSTSRLASCPPCPPSRSGGLGLRGRQGPGPEQGGRGWEAPDQRHRVSAGS